MTTKRHPAEWLEIDQYLEAFEMGQQKTSEIDLREFLPCRDHPHYSAILKELIRVDLEYRSKACSPRTLEDYCQLFPELLRDREAVQEVAFEDYRQRCQRGETPSLAAFEQRYGVDTSRWLRSIALPRFPSRQPRIY